MINKKICMLGASMVGKTALVSQFVYSIFSDRYQTTLGVKISKKQLTIADTEYMLMLWDLEGKNEFTDVNIAYLRGAMGYFIVVDGSCRDTLNDGLTLRDRAQALAPDLPYILLINKEDIRDSWQITDSDIQDLEQRGVSVMTTSAKTGFNVQNAFVNLTRAMHERNV